MTRSGDGSFLAGTVMFDGGTRSDLMSYVVPMDALGNPIWTPTDPEKAFSPIQIELIRVYANAPWMGGYGNYRLIR